MDIFSMGFSSKYDLDEEREREVSGIEQRGERRVLQNHEIEVVEVEFWPVEHPTEPPDEDRPVKLPIPASSIINDGKLNEERYAESFRKRVEVIATENKPRTSMDTEASTRATTARSHCTFTGEDDKIKPLTRMPPLPPLPNQTITVFQMLQQFDKFES